MACPVRRARRAGGQVPVEHVELHEPVEQPQRLVDGDVLLRLRRQASLMEVSGRALEQTVGGAARAALFDGACRTCGAVGPRLIWSQRLRHRH